MMSGPEWCRVASFYLSLKLLQRDLVLEEVVIQARATATPWHLSKYSCCTLSQQFSHWCGAFALGSRRVMGVTSLGMDTNGRLRWTEGR